MMKKRNKADKRRPLPHFAQPLKGLETKVSWNDLALPESDSQHLQEITGHMKRRATVTRSFVHDNDMTVEAGVIALFTGPSGTGKTMAAHILANDVGLSLYRIDLAGSASKYIGETEKNLHRLLDAAEELDVILLFDEAESLFGKRGEVKDGHDRFANRKIDYLFQRMESYQELIILSTNMKSTINQTFLSRIRFVIDFPGSDDLKR